MNFFQILEPLCLEESSNSRGGVFNTGDGTSLWLFDDEVFVGIFNGGEDAFNVVSGAGGRDDSDDLGGVWNSSVQSSQSSSSQSSSSLWPST